MYKKVFLPIGLLAGAVIGGGMFSLPFIFAQVGFLKGLLYLVGVVLLMTTTYLMYADVILKTRGTHNFVSLNDFYLGDLGRFFSVAVSLITMILVLFIYLVLASRFVGPLIVLPFWLLGSVAIFFSLRRLAVIEFLTSLLIVFIIAIIFIWSLPHFSFESFKSIFDGQYTASLFWLPIGPLLFAFAGRAAILELILYSKKNVKETIINSFFAISVVYILFVLSVLFLTGGVVGDDTISSLAGHLPKLLMFLVTVMGLVALWHVYIILGFDSCNILVVDLKWPKLISGLVVVIVPILLYLLGSNNFLVLISLVGGIFAAIENILIVLMWFKLKSKKSFMSKMLGYVTLAAFVIILTHELVAQLYGMG